MLSRELEVTLNLAFKTAREKRHEFMTVEHLLLALLDDASASSVLRACGADLDILRQDLTEFIDSTIPTIPETQLEQETQPTHGFQRVLQRAVFQVNSANHSEVVGANVVVAIFSEQESQAVYFLRLQNIARIDVVNYIYLTVSPNMQTSLNTGTANMRRPIPKLAALKIKKRVCSASLLPISMSKPNWGRLILWWAAAQRLSVSARY